MRTVVTIAALALVACGGEQFTAGSAVVIGDAAGDAAPDVDTSEGSALEGGDEHTGDASPPPDGGTEASSEGGPIPDGGTDGPATGDGCALTTHTNGLGDTWQDCAPLDTYDLPEAMAACVAHYGTETIGTDGGLTAACMEMFGCPSTTVCFSGFRTSYGTCWTYGGAGLVEHMQSVSNPCLWLQVGIWH